MTEMPTIGDVLDAKSPDTDAADLRAATATRILRLPLSRVESASSGDLVTRVTREPDNDSVELNDLLGHKGNITSNCRICSKSLRRRRVCHQIFFPGQASKAARLLTADSGSQLSSSAP